MSQNYQLQPTEFVTPPGRIVSGNPLDPFTTDLKGKPMDPKILLSVACPKNDPRTIEVYNQVMTQAQALCPNSFANGQPTVKFAFKVVDGDDVNFDEGGKRPCDRPGYPGCYIFRFATGAKYPPQCFEPNGGGMIMDPSRFVKGYRVRVMGNISANKDQDGLYLNPKMVEFWDADEPIVGDQVPNTVFGQFQESTQPMQQAQSMGMQQPVQQVQQQPVQQVQQQPVQQVQQQPVQQVQQQPVQQVQQQPVQQVQQQPVQQVQQQPVQQVQQQPVQQVQQQPVQQVQQQPVQQVQQQPAGVLQLTPAAVAQGHTIESLSAVFSEADMITNGLAIRVG